MMAAALAEPRNQRFLLLSESCAPLYPPAVVYQQARPPPLRMARVIMLLAFGGCTRPRLYAPAAVRARGRAPAGARPVRAARAAGLCELTRGAGWVAPAGAPVNAAAACTMRDALQASLLALLPPGLTVRAVAARACCVGRSAPGWPAIEHEQPCWHSSLPGGRARL